MTIRQSAFFCNPFVTICYLLATLDTQEICNKVGIVPHGHKTPEYERLLKAGILPIPLADRRDHPLQPDIEPLPLMDADAIQDAPDLDSDEGDLDEEELDRRL